MGTYCELTIAGNPVLSSKSQPSPLAMTMFREGDKVVMKRHVNARNPKMWGHVVADPEEMETVTEYVATVAAVKDRLRVMGFTLPQVQNDFQAHKDEHVAWLESMGDEDHPELFADEIALLKPATFDDFLDALREIFRSKEHPVWISETNPDASPLVHYMLGDHDEMHWGFPCSDLRCFLRAALEVVADDKLVIQELTDLVDGGYYDSDAKVSEHALDELKGSYSINSPVIVLTEGSTDSEAIRRSLRVLYPHLVDYFAFMDLTVRTPGGASSLVHVVKSFAGAGIENRVVALFDNDTAGHLALSQLKGITLPPTIQAICYPDLELARQYPTLGPSGTTVQDVNGLACSIELFFGRDVIATDGALVPVQWKGFEDRLKRYQGEIGNKAALNDRFLKKTDDALADPSAVERQDWSAMRVLLDALINAYN